MSAISFSRSLIYGAMQKIGTKVEQRTLNERERKMALDKIYSNNKYFLS